MMKTDLTTSIVVAVVGTIVSFFVCGLIVPKTEDFSYPILGFDGDYELSEPNIEVFNFRAVNPTVEIYVGQCTGDNCEAAIIIEADPESESDDTSEDDIEEEEENEEPADGATD